MCAVIHRAKPYKLALLIKKSLDDVISTQPVKPLYNTSIAIFISPLSMLYLQKVLLEHFKKKYIILKLPLHVSFNTPKAMAPIR